MQIPYEEELCALADAVWETPEPGFREYKSSAAHVWLCCFDCQGGVGMYVGDLSGLGRLLGARGCERGEEEEGGGGSVCGSGENRAVTGTGGGFGTGRGRIMVHGGRVLASCASRGWDGTRPGIYFLGAGGSMTAVRLRHCCCFMRGCLS